MSIFDLDEWKIRAFEVGLVHAVVVEYRYDADNIGIVVYGVGSFYESALEDARHKARFVASGYEQRRLDEMRV